MYTGSLVDCKDWTGTGSVVECRVYGELVQCLRWIIEYTEDWY